MPRVNAYKKKIQPRLGDIIEWRSKGATKQSIAEMLGINAATLYHYLNEEQELREAFEKGEVASVDLVEDKLFQRAHGYDKVLWKKTYRYVYDHDGNATRKLEKMEENVIHVQPDVSAQLAILRSKRKDVWGDSLKLETETGGGIIVMPVRQAVEGDQDGQTEDQ